MISEEVGFEPEGINERTDHVGLDRRAAMSTGALEVVLELYVRVESMRIFRRLCFKEVRQLWHMKLDMLNCQLIYLG